MAAHHADRVILGPSIWTLGQDTVYWTILRLYNPLQLPGYDTRSQ